MFIENLARLWSVDDSLPPHADLIALVSFGATQDGLTLGSYTTTMRTQALHKQYPEALVVFGAFTFSPDPGVEERIKKSFFKKAIFAGKVASTIEEAEKIRSALPSGCTPRTILVVTDEWHSRSAKWVWRKVWRDLKPDIRVVAVPSSATIDVQSPMKLARKYWTWALVNVLRHLFLVCVPGSVQLMKKLNLHQPT